MDFDLTEEQRLLKESLDRLIGDRYAFEQRKAYGQNPEGWSREIWSQYAEIGLLGLPFSERYGGSGGGPVETMIAMEAFGRALALEPYLATVVLGGGFLRHGGRPEQCADLLPKIAEGRLTLAFAHTERHSRYDLADIETRAARDGSAWVLDGEKGVVLHGDTADKMIITARVGGGRRDRDGVGLFMIDGGADGVSRRGYPLKMVFVPRKSRLRMCAWALKEFSASRGPHCRSLSGWSRRQSRRYAPRRSGRWRRCMN